MAQNGKKRQGGEGLLQQKWLQLPFSLIFNSKFEKSLLVAYSRVKKDTDPYNISPIEMGVLWAKITFIKSHSKALDFGLQTDIK